MPQSDTTRPPEPSSPPVLGSNASTDPLPAPEDAPASDSEAETERLHDSPVKKRGSIDAYSPIESMRKRLRPDSDHEVSEAARVEPAATNGEGITKAELRNGSAGADPVAAPEPDSVPDVPVMQIPSLPPPDVVALASPTAVAEAVAEVPVTAADDEGSSVEADGVGAVEDEAAEAARIEDDEAGDAEDDDDGDDGDEDDEDDENGDDEDDEDENENDEERIQAISALTEIEVEFADFRDKLHDQQIARFDLEIQMCTKGVHPELEQYHVQISEEREKRLHRSRTLLAYQMRAICNQSHAGRCQVHQTHLKSCHALRGELLGRVTRDWYQINYERRAADRIGPEFGYVAQTRPHQIRRPTARSMGIRYHAGVPLPAAPAMICANEDERDEDLRQLGLR